MVEYTVAAIKFRGRRNGTSMDFTQDRFIELCKRVTQKVG